MGMKLTRLGRLVHLYGSVTTPSWFAAVVKDANRLADEGGDPIYLIDERLAGLKALRDDYWQIVNDVPIPRGTADE